jgi:hypothetical protein
MKYDASKVEVERGYLRLLEGVVNAVNTLIEAGVIVRQSGFMGGGGSVTSHAMNEAWIKTLRLRQMQLAADQKRHATSNPGGE